MRHSATRLKIESAMSAPSREELDHLWRCTRPGLGASSVRDGVHLTSSFGENKPPDKVAPYTFVTARDGGQLRG